MLVRITKTWEFNNAERKQTQLTDSIRINAEDEANPRLQLKAENVFPVTPDQYAVTRVDTPHSVIEWLMFEPLWRTTEPTFAEYTLELSNKGIDTFTFSANTEIPTVGDHVYQGDARTTIAEISGTTLRLADATGILDGSTYANRTECDVLFKVCDENNWQYFYNLNTSAWEVAGAGDWSTMYVVNNHINDLDLKTFGKSIGFVANLRTQNKLYTPLVFSIQLLGRYDIEFTEDIIFDSLIPTMERLLDVTTQVNVKLVSDTDVIDLANEYQIQNDGYNLTNIQVAYNVSTDSDRAENIAASYTLGTPKFQSGHEPGQVHLTSVQPAGSIIELKLNYFPEIAVNTNRDFYEVSKHPMIVFEHIEKKGIVTSPNANVGRNYIRDKLQLIGVLDSPPEQYDLVFEYVVFTGNQTDQHRLGEALHRFFNATDEVRSWALDEPYPMIVDRIFRSENVPNVADINTHAGRFRIANVVEVIREPEDVPLVDYLQNSMTTN